MKSNSICEVSYKGIVCKSEAGLYERQNGINKLVLLSLYGAPQQTRGIFSAVASNNPLICGDLEIHRDRPALHYRSTSIGYAKQHAMVWTGEVGRSVVVYTTEEERINRLRQALSTRRIPHDSARIVELERLLLEHGYLESLERWGPVHGYRCAFNDDEICDLIITDLYGRKLRSEAELKKSAA